MQRYIVGTEAYLVSGSQLTSKALMEMQRLEMDVISSLATAWLSTALVRALM